ncbi:MAG TPA: tetratricopeptide repeat protein [Phycisphaerae bacterium]|nr:tetratricopeptide repeat protein [Phycisphaerae bacterium]
MPRVSMINLAAISVLALASPLIADGSPAQLLEKGIYLEETAGDLEEATKIYGQIVARDKVEASLAAQAYYRLGTCQLKQHKFEQATDTFNQVIQRFPQETQWVRKARAELTRLNRNAPPRVVRTDPPAFKNDVSSDLDKITVTFSQPMTDQSWSWTGGGDTYPEVVGKVAYNATRTVCTLPVKLQPGKVYWVGVNSPSHRNFKSARGVPVPTYVILFATAGTDGKPTEIPADMLASARRINQAAEAGDSAVSPQSIPVIVKTEPAAFDRDVPANLDKITVTFSRPMTDRSWSWTGGGDTYPEVVGKIAYNDTQTVCTLPVKLHPGKVYWVGVNGPSYRNFKSAEGVPAPWYVILFATADADGKPTPIPDDLLQRARKINEKAKKVAARAGAATREE